MIELTNSMDDKLHGGTFSNMVYIEYKETQNKNLFEEVIDDLMLTEYSDDQKSIDYVESLDLKEKRMAILSLMGDGDGSDDGRFKNLREKISGENEKVSKVTHLLDALENLRVFIKYGSVRNKTLGEIMTPIEELAKPMIKLVEKYDSTFWENPDHKVLDSSAGLGTFLILSLFEFMKGLEKWEPDTEKRYKHIVENCLYYGELQSRNVFFWLCLIDPYDEYITNTYWGSFLLEGFDKHMKDVWEVESFDLCISNPPYQVRKEGFKKTQPIWHLFVQKSLELLREDKYMVMVHPDSWRSLKGIFKDTQNLLKNKKMMYVEFHNKDEGFELFGATTTYDFYLLKNSKNDNHLSKIKCINGDIEMVDLSLFDFIPNGRFIDFDNLVSKSIENKIDFIYSRSLYGNDKKNMSIIKDDHFKYPCVYYTYKDSSYKLWYSSEKKGHFNVPKIIFSNGGASTPIIDKNGDYGIMNFAYGIGCDDVDEMEQIRESMMSVEFMDLMSFSDGNSGVGGQRYNPKIISTFRKDFWKEFI